MSYPPYQGYGQPPQQGYGQQGQYYQPPPPQGQGGYAPPPPQGQGYYGQPPPNQYPPPGAPPNQQYGGYAPPPTQGYQQYPGQQAPPQGQGYYQQPPPPQGQYGQPPAPYGAPPSPQPPYGAPPPGQYGAPPNQYGAPPNQYGQPPQQYGAQYPPTPASPGYGPPQIINWDATADAQACRTAMKGFGTDEKLLIRTLTSKDPLQIEALKASFQRQFNRNLINDIEKETSGYLEYGLMGVARGPLLNDVYTLRDALKGAGTNEALLNDVLLSRSNADIQAIKGAYYQTFSRRLEDDVKGDLSGKTERHFLMVLAATRAEDSAPVVPQQVDQDVLEIYKASEGRMGTDELLICSIFTSRNDNQLRAIAHAYKQRYSKDLEKVIKSEFSGHMEDALLYQLRHANDKYMHAATLLEDTMAGAGTRDKLLTSRVVRYHWDRNDLNNIRGAYSQRFGRDLARRIKGETSGDFERFLLSCIGEPI